jgi:hypothetical protein
MHGREFKTLLILASYTLQRLDQSGTPIGSCSGTIVQKHGHRVLLTVSHSVTPNEMWAVEVCYDAKNGMKLWKLGSMDYVMAIDQAGTREVDFAFRSVPDALRSYYTGAHN